MKQLTYLLLITLVSGCSIFTKREEIGPPMPDAFKGCSIYRGRKRALCINQLIVKLEKILNGVARIKTLKKNREGMFSPYISFTKQVCIMNTVSKNRKGKQIRVAGKDELRCWPPYTTAKIFSMSAGQVIVKDLIFFGIGIAVGFGL